MTSLKSEPTALITGATRGIGRELARVFARRGFRLFLTGRDGALLEALADELRRDYQTEVFTFLKDLEEEKSADEIFRRTREQGLTIQALVNNAGFGRHGFFHELDLEAQMRMIRVNVSALTKLCGLYVPGMVARGEGKILNVASTASFQPGPLMAVYFATKAYVLSFSEALRSELAGTGVGVSVLAPGPTESDFARNAGILKNNKIFSFAMPADRVAEAGYAGLMKGKGLIIPGFLNRAAIFLNRITPRPVIVSMVKFLQEQKR